LSIELSNACNSNCIMCPRADLTRRIQHMPMEVLEKIISDCRKQPLRKINLFWFGDSLTNPKFIDQLRIIRKALPKATLNLSTNAELLTLRRSDLILNEDLLDRINFDIDGVTKKTYQSIRRGVNFDLVMKNVHYFIDKRNKLGKGKPRISVTIIKMTKTLSEIDDFKSYWKNHADKVEVNDYNTWLGSKPDFNVGNTLKRSREGGFDFPCIHPWNELVISADGKAGLCCLDYDLTAEVGDVTKEKIEDIWTGEKMAEYRNHIMKLDYHLIAPCRNCNSYIYQDKTWWAKLWR
jgi:radical SAM protein with 4Fe4S-binding SPASM domain